MSTRDPDGLDDKAVEIQIFPRGVWHVIGAVVCMAISLAIVLVLIALLTSPWFSTQTVLVIGLCLFVLAVFLLVTPTFLLTRGSAKWHSFLKRFNLFVVGILIVAGAISLIVGDSSMATTCASGLFFSLIAYWLYRASAHAECVEYYRKIWEYRRHHVAQDG